jgi:magnesium transporter
MDPPSQHDLPKIFINDHELVDHEDDDIYRGDRPSTPQATELGSVTSLKSFSTASSGSFRLAGGRLGALATRLERAITRWARKNWADSSSSITSSNTSESSRSSFRTANKSSRRKRRPPSLADIQHRAESERAVAARIRAREIGRVVPREFNLYVPPSSPSQEAGLIEEEQRVVRTFSLDVMLLHLNPLLRKSGKHRRPRHRSRFPRTGFDEHQHLRELYSTVHSAIDESSDASRTAALHGVSLTVEKGKDKISSTTPPPDPLRTASTSRRDPVAGKPQQAWWLDVSSPSWEDMKTLGRVNNLFLLSMVKLTRGIVVASSPTDSGGYPTAGTTREIRVVPKARLLFYHLSCSRIFDSP